MSATAKTTFDWADDQYTFRLPLAQLRELQRKTGVGPHTVYTRLHNGGWEVDDIREAIRLGLIGGGLEPVKALALVREYVDKRPLMENLQPAQLVLMAALVGIEDDQPDLGSGLEGDEPGKAEAEEMATGSPSQTSMEPEPS